MNRNLNSHFAQSPRIHVSRTKFDRDFGVKTSFNVGQIVPICLDEILPGDTMKLRTSKVVRLQTLLTPLLDNLFLDTYFFFVPTRLIWEHFQAFMGEPNDNPWLPSVEYQIPQIAAPSGGWNVGSLADYFGIPTGVDGFTCNALPFRAYCKIINDWFRDENVCSPLNFPLNDTTITGSNGDTFISDCVKGGSPYIAAKIHDYFTSALPHPQRGDAVEIGLGGTAPVFGDGKGMLMQRQLTGQYPQKYFYMNTGSDVAISGDEFEQYTHLGVLGDNNISPDGVVSAVGDSGSRTFTDHEPGGIAAGKVIGLADSNAPFSTGVYADLSAAGAISVNSLRVAFQVQKFYERLALSGSRYIELLRSMFGVTSPDARLQRSEYLGGNRMYINVHQVVQQSSTDSVTPQGHVTGYSVTSDTHNDFTKSFVEHGYLIGVAVARYKHTYQQGLNRLWSRKDRFDFYWPLFQNLGEQPILNKELFLSGSDEDEEVFAYQEAWADYRYKPSTVTGEMRSAYAQSLDIWHLADDYSQLPSLSPEWLQEDKAPVDRVLAVTSAVSNQLFGDFWFKYTCVRAMPLYSIPGLIDHH